jgi:hypothetical protein
VPALRPAIENLMTMFEFASPDFASPDFAAIRLPRYAESAGAARAPVINDLQR